MEKRKEIIFLGGSKTIGTLPDKAIGYLKCFMDKGAHFLVGDCHGADLALQKYLHSKGYRNVTVYCSGDKCRFNVGVWEEKHIPADGSEGYEFYRQKDIAMANACDYGLFLWDRKSKATQNNMSALRLQGKAVFTYYSDTNILRVTKRKNKAINQVRKEIWKYE